MLSTMAKQCAGIAQLVERNLAKVEVASSSLVSRLKYFYENRLLSVIGLNDKGHLALGRCPP